jgi:hypothetical protein
MPKASMRFGCHPGSRNRSQNPVNLSGEALRRLILSILLEKALKFLRSALCPL